MAHQYLPKIFYGACKNPPPPSYILNVLSLVTPEVCIPCKKYGARGYREPGAVNF